MLIEFTRDYRGAATAEEHYPAGTVVDLPLGQLIVDEGAAIPYVAPEPIEAEADDPPTTEPAEPKPRGRKVPADG